MPVISPKWTNKKLPVWHWPNFIREIVFVHQPSNPLDEIDNVQVLFDQTRWCQLGNWKAIQKTALDHIKALASLHRNQIDNIFNGADNLRGIFIQNLLQSVWLNFTSIIVIHFMGSELNRCPQSKIWIQKI